MSPTYLDRLAARTRVTATVLCLGLDPDPASIPDRFARGVAGLERFAALVLEAALPHVTAVKPNLAFFEAFGSGGVAALERLRATIPSDIPVIADAKRGDIGSTAARQAVALFDVIQSVDRERLAAALVKEMERLGRRPACYIQVNTGEEPQKAGILPKDVDAFVALCRDQYKLPIVGLMCIPPVDEEPALHFALLAKMAARNGLAGLSMGMSADYETAVRMGATHVRVGSALFGSRPPLSPPQPKADA